MPLVEAARRAAVAEMEVVVRLDMAAMDEWEKELELIDLHLRHGDLNAFAKVRCLVRAYAIRDEVPEASRRPYQEGKLNDVVAQHLRISPRNAARYISVADLPRPIRQAFEAGLIRIELAERVRKLPDATLNAIAVAIDGGAYPATAVAAHLRPKRERPKPLGVKIDKVVKKLKGALEDVPELGGQAIALTSTQQAELRHARDKVNHLLEKCRTVDEEDQRANREALLRTLRSQPGRTTVSSGPVAQGVEVPLTQSDA